MPLLAQGEFMDSVCLTKDKPLCYNEFILLVLSTRVNCSPIIFIHFCCFRHHCIQAVAPPANILAMWEALRVFGLYGREPAMIVGM
jgi:hypothetical protein